MQPKTSIEVNVAKRIVHITMSGIYDQDAMVGAVDKMKAATQSFHGQAHIYLADMRGMKTAHPSVAALLGGGIAWTRANGVGMCAHVSDDTVQRLQALRVARQATPGDDVTVDCNSLDEALRVVKEASERLTNRMPIDAASFLERPGAR